MKETKGERKVRLESSHNMTNRIKESGKVYKREKVYDPESDEEIS